MQPMKLAQFAKQANGDMLAFLAAKKRGLSDEEADAEAGKGPCDKEAAMQDNDGSAVSAAGEGGFTYRSRAEDYAKGSDAWDSCDRYLHTDSTKKPLKLKEEDNNGALKQSADNEDADDKWKKRLEKVHARRDPDGISSVEFDVVMREQQNKEASSVPDWVNQFYDRCRQSRTPVATVKEAVDRLTSNYDLPELEAGLSDFEKSAGLVDWGKRGVEATVKKFAPGAAATGGKKLFGAAPAAESAIGAGIRKSFGSAPSTAYNTVKPIVTRSAAGYAGGGAVDAAGYAATGKDMGLRNVGALTGAGLGTGLGRSFTGGVSKGVSSGAGWKSLGRGVDEMVTYSTGVAPRSLPSAASGTQGIAGKAIDTGMRTVGGNLAGRTVDSAAGMVGVDTNGWGQAIGTGLGAGSKYIPSGLRNFAGGAINVPAPGLVGKVTNRFGKLTGSKAIQGVGNSMQAANVGRGFGGRLGNAATWAPIAAPLAAAGYDGGKNMLANEVSDIASKSIQTALQNPDNQQAASQALASMVKSPEVQDAIAEQLQVQGSGALKSMLASFQSMGDFGSIEGIADSVLGMVGLDPSKMSTTNKVMTILGGLGMVGGFAMGNNTLGTVGTAALAGGAGPQVMENMGMGWGNSNVGPNNGAAGLQSAAAQFAEPPLEQQQQQQQMLEQVMEQTQAANNQRDELAYQGNQ